MHSFQFEYFIKWKNFDVKYNTWEPINNLNCDELIENFERTRILTILGVQKENGQAKYLIKFQDNGCTEEIESRIAAKIWTQNVIDFLEKKIEWIHNSGNDDHRTPQDQPAGRGNFFKMS